MICAFLQSFAVGICVFLLICQCRAGTDLLLFLKLIRVERFDDPRRTSDNNGIVRHVLCNHRPRADDRVLSLADAGQDSCSGSDPRISFYQNRFTQKNDALVHIVIARNKLHVCRNIRARFIVCRIVFYRADFKQFTARRLLRELCRNGGIALVDGADLSCKIVFSRMRKICNQCFYHSVPYV